MSQEQENQSRSATVIGASSLTAVALFCGASQPLVAADFDAHRPGQAQILPVNYDADESKSQNNPTSRSNGCGTRIHTGAVSMRKMWHGSRSGTSNLVVDLEYRYIPSALKSAVKTRLAECGCLRGPVGCAVCGNALGAMVSRCKTHTGGSLQTVYEFAPSAVSPPLPPAAEDAQPTTARSMSPLQPSFSRRPVPRAPATTAVPRAANTAPRAAARTAAAAPNRTHRMRTLGRPAADDDGATTRRLRVGRSRPRNADTNLDDAENPYLLDDDDLLRWQPGLVSTADVEERRRGEGDVDAFFAEFMARRSPPGPLAYPDRLVPELSAQDVMQSFYARREGNVSAVRQDNASAVRQGRTNAETAGQNNVASEGPDEGFLDAFLEELAAAERLFQPRGGAS
ncbi:hypothetical protein C8R43DRAFT_1040967 [Mycena crocata]|nr:hypothetical protein C8R43DRAFT_1040967 [Mycena crocata]